MARPEEVEHGWMHGKLFTLAHDVDGERYLGYWDNGNPVMEPVPLKAGQLVKVVMVSRFGDCGITPDLDAEHGYVARVQPNELFPQKEG